MTHALGSRIEAQFLCTALRTLSKPQAERRAILPAFQAMPDDFDWPHFHELLAFHRIGALIYPVLLQRWGAAAPSHMAAPHKTQAMQRAKQSLSQRAALSKLHAEFAEAGIAFILMKGAAISERYYQNPQARTAIDIDILVAGHDFKDSCARLQSLGFVMKTPDWDVPPKLSGISRMFHADYAFVHKGFKVCVELHNRFAKNPYLFALSSEAAFTASETLNLNGQDFRVLPTPLQFVYSCAHGAKHDWFRLKWLTDIDFMIAAMAGDDWTQMWKTARDLKLIKTVRETLSLHRCIFGVSPHYVIDWPAPKAIAHYAQTMQRMQLIEDTQITDMGYIFRQIKNNFARVPCWRYRCYNLFLMLADFDDVKRLRLPQKWWPLYMFTGLFGRVFRVLGRSFSRKA